MSQIRHVAQEHPNGCGTACIAMVTGRTYAEARAFVGGDYERGMTHYEWWEALARCGFAVQFIYRREQRVGNLERPKWPLDPWAPAHIVQVGNHFIVMLHDGSILDPAIHLQSCTDRLLSDYSADRIYSIGGVFPVGNHPQFNSTPEQS